MENKEKNETNSIDKKIKISICLTIIILGIHFITSYFFTNNLINGDKFESLIGIITKSWIMPYNIIVCGIQIISLILVLVNKNKKQSLNIINVIIEVIYFIGATIIVIPNMYFNFFRYNKILSDIIIFLFEILNIYTIVIMIKKIFIYNKAS